VLPTAAFPGSAAQARLAGRLCLAVFGVLVIVGLLIRLSDNPARLVIGAVAAIAGGIPLFLLSLRPVLTYAAAGVATAGVVVLGNADSRSIVWFALLMGSILLACFAPLPSLQNHWREFREHLERRGQEG